MDKSGHRILLLATDKVEYLSGFSPAGFGVGDMEPAAQEIAAALHKTKSNIVI